MPLGEKPSSKTFSAGRVEIIAPVSALMILTLVHVSPRAQNVPPRNFILLGVSPGKVSATWGVGTAAQIPFRSRGVYVRIGGISEEGQRTNFS